MIKTELKTAAIKCELCERVAAWQMKAGFDAPVLFVCDRHAGADSYERAAVQSYGGVSRTGGVSTWNKKAL